ncbi:Putative glycosyl transferase CAP10 domain-containing protein [Septoria linicola]|uniref:Glycosyl transferase CAP10 domain-containing protein n=1 Tax=Septoria linicola TaxID=215465 RepID=A0A9Q9ARS4_9PEZI|nr:putative glycosyl transferase CAP10 domain-containing protein [Septoria linicola]USW49586.1 Putative glycosyl transferase CAP10 domain-containing protein [Septoria linicola]
MLAKQSSTFEQAEAEYVRRYQRSPPPGLEQWFEYAKAENSLIIDEFDIIDQAIKPYLERSGAEIADNVQQVAASAAFSWSCTIADGRLRKNCAILGEETMSLLSDVRILAHIPNIEFVGNQLDEPRILLEQQPAAISSRRRRERSDGEPITWGDLGEKPAWKRLAIDQCNHFSESHSSEESGFASVQGIETLGLPFVQNVTDAMDICRHPEYEHLHGFWESPTTLKYTHSALPILSPGIPSTMNDIPFPAIAYTMSSYSYDETEIVDYSLKQPGLYWAGKTTGGYQRVDDNDEGWVPLHRQRFVAKANNLENETHTYLRRTEEGGLWKAVNDEAFNNSFYHVHFTEIVQCDETARKHQKEYFDVKPPDSRAEAGKYTLVFDSDGNGHSARYYRLLQSKSLPLKQTIFREWHDDRLQPWLHYVPVSLAMDELPEVVRYFVEEAEGRELAQEMAIKGREWSLQVLRPVDQVIYLYRLLLELARLQDPARVAGSPY